MSQITLTKGKVKKLLTDLESEQIERTTSKSDTEKFAQAVCAFSNDLSNSSRNGYLLIGVNDNGTLSGLKATDKLLQSLGGLRSDGNILPQPIMSTQAFSFSGGDVIVLEIQPSPFPPVRYKGRTWIRVGPRKAIASDMEERLLIEKRTANVSTFDIRPSQGNGIDALNTRVFIEEYLPNAVQEDELALDNRSVEEKLASLRFYSSNYGSITNAGLLLFGKDVESNIPGAYIQYVKFSGRNEASDVQNEKKFSGNLIEVLQELDTFIEYVILQQKPVAVSVLKENKQLNYPQWALRELLMNAIMHRDYESNAPVKFYQYSDRIEVINPGDCMETPGLKIFPM
ncbi:MAG: helix-turn-helix domain-containing protein [Marinilabiliaceae bacterium]